MYRDVIELDMDTNQIENITDFVQDIVSESGVENGLCLIHPLHSTCSVFLNEDDPMLMEDLREALEEIAPEEKVYHHPSNAHSHLRSMLVGRNEVLPVVDGKLERGTWQSVMIGSWDVRSRKREILVMVY